MMRVTRRTSGSLGRPWALVAVAFGLLICQAGGCITVEGTSSRKMKRAMTDSFLYRSLDLFYPDGRPQNPATFPRLNRSQVRTIESAWGSSTRKIAAYHGDRVAYLRGISDRSLPDRLDVSLRVVNTGQPNARVQSDGEILVDVKVAQALFRAALVAAYRGGGMSGDPFDTSPPTDASEAEALAAFFDLRDEIDATQGRTMVGDLFGSSDLEGGWFSMADYLQISEAVDQHYWRSITFLLAHELGHLALGHLGSGAQPNCAELTDLETEADIYAVLIIEDMTRSEALLGGFGGWAFGADHHGYEAFFELAYSFAGFDLVAEGARCPHPDPGARLAATEEAFQVVREARIEASNEALWRQLEEAMAAELGTMAEGGAEMEVEREDP